MCGVCNAREVLCFCVYGSFSVKVMTVLSVRTKRRQKKGLDDEKNYLLIRYSALLVEHAGNSLFSLTVVTCYSCRK